MLFFLSIIAGGIGASAAAGLLPRVAYDGIANIALGLFAGTVVWVMSVGIITTSDELTILLLTLGFSASSGALLSIAVGFLSRFFGWK